MLDTRESRASASESKFVLDTALAAHVRQWAREHLHPDAYGAGPFGDEYRTSSLYFDTRTFDVFHRRGSYGRGKYRIRRYAGANYVFLERKMRRPGLLVKRRTQMPVEVLARLADGEIRKGEPGHWFAERLRVRALEPACRLSYHRTARGLMTEGGLARLTLDDGIRVEPADRIALPEGGVDGTPVLDGRVILELKFRGALPPIFEALVRTFDLRVQTASKYRLGMLALGHVLAPSDPREESELDSVRS